MIKTTKGLEIYNGEWLRQEAAMWRADLRIGGLCRNILTRRGTESV
jgi:hypothetical protein